MLFLAKLKIKDGSIRHYGIECSTIDDAMMLMSRYIESKCFDVELQDVIHLDIQSQSKLIGFDKYLLSCCNKYRKLDGGKENENIRNDSNKLFQNIFRIR